MKTIKFSHDYFKLPLNWQGSTAILVGVYQEQIKNINLFYPRFLVYDTMFKGEKGHYDLNFQDAIILSFIHVRTGIPFTTVRRFDQEKLNYYMSSLGEPFEMVLQKA
jgi:hypothetical protein